MWNLCYVFPGFDDHVSIKANFNSPGWLDWLYHMVSENPEVVFFYTVETTDIF